MSVFFTGPGKGAFFTKVVDLGASSLKLEIWDTAGQEKYHSVCHLYFRGANAALLVYDITRKDSFHKAQQWLKDLEKELQPGEVLVMLVGNKTDLSEEREVTFEVLPRSPCCSLPQAEERALPTCVKTLALTRSHRHPRACMYLHMCTRTSTPPHAHTHLHTYTRLHIHSHLHPHTRGLSADVAPSPEYCQVEAAVTQLSLLSLFHGILPPHHI
nr:ras-related protein Rab-19-like [Aotus nancymaae]